MTKRRAISFLVLLVVLGVVAGFYPWGVPVARAQIPSVSPNIDYVNLSAKACRREATQWAEIKWGFRIGANVGVRNIMFQVEIDGRSLTEPISGSNFIIDQSDGSIFLDRVPDPTGTGKYSSSQYKGLITTGSPNTSQVVAIYSTEYRRNFIIGSQGYQSKNLNFTLIDTKALDSRASRQYKITPFVYYSESTNPLPGGLNPSLGRLPALNFTLDPNLSGSCSTGFSVGDLRNTIFSNSSESQAITIRSERPPTIVLPGNPNTNTSRPNLTFTLKYVVRVRGASLDKNIFYFYGQSPYNELAIRITDDNIPGLGVFLYNDINNPDDDEPGGRGFINLSFVDENNAGAKSFLDNVINVYYNKPGVTTKCDASGKGGWSLITTGNTAGIATESSCISVEELARDGIGTNESTPTIPRGDLDGDDPCSKFQGKGVLGFIGKYLCAAGFALAGIAAAFAGITFDWLLSAAGLQ